MTLIREQKRLKIQGQILFAEMDAPIFGVSPTNSGTQKHKYETFSCNNCGKWSHKAQIVSQLIRNDFKRKAQKMQGIS